MTLWRTLPKETFKKYVFFLSEELLEVIAHTRNLTYIKNARLDGKLLSAAPYLEAHPFTKLFLVVVEGCAPIPELQLPQALQCVLIRVITFCKHNVSHDSK